MKLKELLDSLDAQPRGLMDPQALDFKVQIEGSEIEDIHPHFDIEDVAVSFVEKRIIIEVE